MTSFPLSGGGLNAQHGWQSEFARQSRCCPVHDECYGASGGTKWPMQPFWALSIPSLDALEECERVHFKVVPSKKRSRKTTTPPGMTYPLSPRSETEPETLTTDVAFGFTEMMAEHIARAFYFR
jgi:hypothetical protein